MRDFCEVYETVSLSKRHRAVGKNSGQTDPSSGAQDLWTLFLKALFSTAANVTKHKPRTSSSHRAV
ncbi:MAG: hypothetical protein AAGF98_11205 [Cyanobacteria bacterium P01_H01_bin.153]